MADRKASNSEMVQGTLDMLVLRTLVTGPAHGHTIAHVIEHMSENVLEVEQGSLYPALHRLEHRGWVSSYWGTSENNRKAKFYKLTAAGKKQLTAETDRRRLVVAAIGRVLGESKPAAFSRANPAGGHRRSGAPGNHWPNCVPPSPCWR